jgi:hypothetical protein
MVYSKFEIENLKFDELVCDAGVGLTRSDVVKLLEKSCKEFVEAQGNSKIGNIHIDNCGKGNGYLSMVLKFRLQFVESGRPDFLFVLKVPLPNAMTKMIDGEDKGSESVEKEPKNEEPDENARTIIDGHNLECEFYTRFQGQLHNYPMPRVFYMRKIDLEKSNASSFQNSSNCGLILMEDLSTEDHEILGLWRTGNAEQVYQIAKAIAKFQFYVEKKGEHRDWWMKLDTNLHLDAFYSSWLPVGMEAAKDLGKFSELLPRVKAIFSRSFGHYAIRQKAHQYGATTICQGDVNPFNVFFKRDSNGKLTDQLRAIIDYQILLYGNPCFDLARFICCSIDGEIRKESDFKAYEIYYRELEALTVKDGSKMKFTFEQGIELYHLAMCQQATFIVSFLFFIRAMAKQNEATAKNFPNLIKRAEYSLERALEYMNIYGLNRSFDKQ